MGRIVGGCGYENDSFEAIQTRGVDGAVTGSRAIGGFYVEFLVCERRVD